MFFEPSPQTSRFLTLAMKASSNTATKDELDELRSMTRPNKDLEKELLTLRREAREEADCEFTLLFLRVLFGTAKSEEVARVQGLASTNPEQWVAFQQLRFALDELSRRGDSPSTGSEADRAAHERIRQTVLAKLTGK